RERAAELVAVQDVAPRSVPAELGRAERAPGDAVTRPIETAERSGETFRTRQIIRVGHEHLVHADLAGARCAQAELAVDGRRRQTLHTLLEDETTDDAGVVFRPDDEDVG